MIIDLDDVLISKRIKDTWILMLDYNCNKLLELYPDLISSDIPNEMFRLKPNGDGELFIIVRKTRISLSVPKCEFKLK